MSKTPLILLHGALGAADLLQPLAQALGNRFHVHALEFEGHGATPAADRPFRIAHFAANVLALLDARGYAAADLFGHSLGGYVAVWLAQHHPQRVRRVMTLGTKFNWTPEFAAAEIRQLDPDKIAVKVPHFAAQLAARHTANDWRATVTRTADLLATLGGDPPLTPDGLATILTPVRIALGDRDRMTTLAESSAAYHALPAGSLHVLPDTPHPLERVAVPRLAAAVSDAFGNDQ